MTVIDSFKGKYDFLSNFHQCKIEVDGIIYPTVEHAFQALKSDDLVYRKAILSCQSPGQAKRLGRAANLRPDWESVKISVMESLLEKKFTPGSDLANKLIETYPASLYEGNWWGDNFWGVYRGAGHNHLGRLLMKIRSNLMDISTTDADYLTMSE